MDEVEILLKQMKSENEYISVTANRALMDIGEAAVPVLIEALKDEDWNGRWNAVVALGKIGDVSAVVALRKVLKDENEKVRKQAAEALGKIVKKCETIEEVEKLEEGIFKVLIELRKEKDRDIRINAQMEVARLTREIAEKKDRIVHKRDLLLDDKPKPPKKGRGIYHTARRVRNG